VRQNNRERVKIHQVGRRGQSVSAGFQLGQKYSQGAGNLAARCAERPVPVGRARLASGGGRSGEYVGYPRRRPPRQKFCVTNRAIVYGFENGFSQWSPGVDSQPAVRKQ
jgi:hypothetical protein